MALRDKEAIAAKLNGYAEKLTGFAILQSISLAFTFTNKDFGEVMRKYGSFTKGSIWIGLAYSFYFVTILMCHIGEDKLLGQPKSSTPESAWAGYIRLGQLGIVYISFIINFCTLGMFY
jgi:hypothetical protein